MFQLPTRLGKKNDIAKPSAPTGAQLTNVPRNPKERASARNNLIAPILTSSKRKDSSTTIGNSTTEYTRSSRTQLDINVSREAYGGPPVTPAPGQSLNQFLQMMDATKTQIKEKIQPVDKLGLRRASANANLPTTISKQTRQEPKDNEGEPMKLLDFFAQKPKFQVTQTQPSAPDFQRGLSLTERESAPMKMHPGIKMKDVERSTANVPRSTPFLSEIRSKRDDSAGINNNHRHLLEKPNVTASPTEHKQQLSMPRTVLKVLFCELLSAAQRGESKLIEFTIKSIESERSSEGVREFIDQLDSNGLGLVHYAVKLQNEDLFYFLLAKNADFDLPDSSGITPLMHLALDAWPDVNQIMINSVQNCNSLDSHNNNVFHYAVLKKNLELITTLLESKSDLLIRQRNDDGLTPTELADTSIIVKLEGLFKKYERNKAYGSQSEDNGSVTVSESQTSFPKSRTQNDIIEPEENSACIRIHFSEKSTRKEANKTLKDTEDRPSKFLIKVESNKEFDVFADKQKHPKSDSITKAYKQQKTQNEYGLGLKSQFTKKRQPEECNLDEYSPSKAMRTSASNKVAPPLIGRRSEANLTVKRDGNEHKEFLPTKPIASGPTMKLNKDSTNTSKMKFGFKPPSEESKITNIRQTLTKPLGLSSKTSQITVKKTPARQLPSITIDDFIVHSIIGTGSFGKVYLVQRKETQSFFAMKTLNKADVARNNLKRYAMTERNVLKQVDHPFIVKLRYALQNADYLFLIMDFMPGGDLGYYLERDTKFSERRARIYTCEIVLGIAELHRNDIIFRDLKPDNILLDEDGHVLLSDFGLSKENVRSNNNEKSFCGTYAYLAPEMVKKTGHGKAMDWYLVGTLLFEMVTGVPPFYSDDQKELFHNIKTERLVLPDFLSPELKDLLAQLLEKDPQKRIDQTGIQRHSWFRDVNWDDVLARRLVPPRPHLVKPRLNEIEHPETLFGQSRTNKLPVENWTFIDDPTPPSPEKPSQDPF